MIEKIEKEILERLKDYPVYNAPQKLDRYIYFPLLGWNPSSFKENLQLDFSITVYTFGYSDALKMRDELISKMNKEIYVNGWKLWLHAITHSVKRRGKNYQVDIVFIWRVEKYDNIEIIAEKTKIQEKPKIEKPITEKLQEKTIVENIPPKKGKKINKEV